jgi:ribose transport system substrate-binding protein
MNRAALAAILTASIATPALADGETIALLTKNQTNPFFQAERIGAEKAAAGLHAKLLSFVPTQPDSIPEQMSEIDDVIVKKPDAIVMVPVDYKAMTPGIDKINAAGIPVVNVTDRSAGGKFIAFIGANDYDIARSTGRALLQALGGKGNIIILEGVRGTLTSADRVRGFQDAIKEFPGAKLVDSQPGNYQRLQANQVMENLLQANPDVAGVMAANDAMAAGVIDALADAGSKALVVGINGTKEAVDAIKAGKMLATGDYNGFKQGCIGVMIAVRSLRKEPVPTNVVLPAVVIDKSNLAEYDTPVAERSCPAWADVPKS